MSVNPRKFKEQQSLNDLGRFFSGWQIQQGRKGNGVCYSIYKPITSWFTMLLADDVI